MRSKIAAIEPEEADFGFSGPCFARPARRLAHRPSSARFSAARPAIWSSVSATTPNT